MRILRWLCLFILLPFFLLCVFVWFCFVTESGTSFVFKLSNFFLASHLQVGKVEGRLWDNLILYNVYFNTRTASLKTDQLTVSWHPILLYKKHIAIEQIQTKNMVISIKDETKNTVKSENQVADVKNKKIVETKKIGTWQLSIHSLECSNTSIKRDGKIVVALSKLILQTKIGKYITVESHLDLIKPFALQTDLNIQGELNHYQWLVSIKNTQSDWSMCGYGNQQGMRFTTTRTKLFGGNLSTAGQFNWLPNFNFDMNAKLRLYKASAVIQGGLANDWDLHYQIHASDLSQFHKNLKGAADVSGRIFGSKQEPHATANLAVKKLQLSSAKNLTFDGNGFLHLATALTESDKFEGLFKLKQSNLRYQKNERIVNFPLNGFLEIAQTENGLNSTGQFNLLNKQFLSLYCSLPHYHFSTDNLSSQTIHTKADLQLNPAQVTRLSSLWLDNFSGYLRAGLDLNGNFQSPKLTGFLKFNADKTKVSRLGLTLRQLALNANLKDNNLNYKGSVVSGDGMLQLVGNATLKDQLSSANFSIKGKDFLMSNTSDMTAYVSPEIKVDYMPDKAWIITGHIDVPKADIKLNQSTAVTLPPETVIIMPDGQIVKKESLPVSAEISIRVQPKTHLVVDDLESFIGGQVSLQNYPTGLAFATGKLNLIQGAYNLQGEKLAIKQGAIMYNHSPLDNPQLNIRATKTIQYTPTTTQLSQHQNLKVGMQITGTAQEPNITLFSDPTGWSQPDILSLIMLGQPANTASGSELQLLSVAAKSLSGKNSMGITQFTQQLQQFFGFSDFGLQSGLSTEDGEEKKTTSFVFGRYLMPRLYLNYSIGMLDAINTLRLKYTISKRWFIQTQSSTLGSGADIFYFLEH